MSFTTSKNCLLCNKPTELVLSLGKTPLANELFKTKKAPELFPLNLMKCISCNHLQLDTLVNEDRMYKHYLYTANTSQTNRDYFKQYAEEMFDRFNPLYVLDIGSNDGLFLSNFQKLGCEVLGVDPAKNIAKQANAKGIPTIPDFFHPDMCSKVQFNYGQFDLITCNNCFAHNADLTSIVSGVKQLLAPNGVFVFEVSYAMALLKDNLFDLVYHEHIHHWHLGPAMKFFKKFGLNVFDVQKTPTHGGSIRIFVQKQDHHKKSANLKAILKEERQITKLAGSFSKNVNKIKTDLKKEIKGKEVSVLGYPAKACTLSYFFELDNIKNVFDDNPLKVGRFSHKGVKISSTKDIAKKKPEYLLILAWNYAEELVKRFPGNQFIIPLPKVKVVK